MDKSIGYSYQVSFFHMMTIIRGSLFGVLLFAGITAFAVIYYWVKIKYYILKDHLFQKYGKAVKGTIKEFYYFVSKEDIEYTEYHIEYEYFFKGKMYKGRDWFLINTAHLEWANIGMLMGYPRIRFKEKDIVSLIEKGKNIEIRLLPLFPNIKKVCYPQIIYDAFDF